MFYLTKDSFLQNFTEYTLTDQECLHLLLATLFFYIIYFAICRSVFGSDRKRLSWCVSLFNSLLMSLLGMVYIYGRSTVGKNIFPFVTDITPIFYGRDNVGVAICLLFSVSLVVDIVFGICFYLDKIQLLSGWIHHALYLWLMHYLITGNGFFTVEQYGMVALFAWSTIQEIPTFLLALGSIFPAYRTDLGFGLTFLLFRIIFHGYLFYFTIRGKPNVSVIVLYVITMFMHLNWFHGWVTKYAFGSSKKAGKGKQKDSNGSELKIE